MIAVIADDLTGAAELAGIGLRYGLATEIVLNTVIKSNADLLVICTDTRSMTKAGAQRITGDVVKEIILMNPDLIYKKIDSVFRGHVLEELKIQILVAGKQKALIIAANPSLGRTIREGIYYIHEKPIHTTGFANDPEFAITGSSVLQMLKAGDDGLQVLRHTDPLPDEGIVIGEAVSENDIKDWADKAGGAWMLVGASDFFTALLNKRYTASSQQTPVIQGSNLYVCGTAFDKRHVFIKEVEKNLNCVIYLPVNDKNGKDWIKKVHETLERQQKAIIAFRQNEIMPVGISATFLRELMADAVREIIEKETISELFIEGGSTAAAVLKEMKIEKLEPVNEWQRGVVRMKAKELYITVKPGSYEWPEEIERLYSIK